MNRWNKKDLEKRREDFKKWKESSYKNLLEAKDRMKSHWAEYCMTAPIHGLRYLGERKRPYIEKLLWVVVIVVSMCYAYVCAKVQMDKFREAPIEERQKPMFDNLTDIPFPAVTICDNRKSWYKEDKGGVTDALNKKKREAKLFLCGDPHPLSEGTNHTILITMSPNFKQSCIVTNDNPKIWTNCTKMFKQTVTDVGVCHTFNMFRKEDLMNKDMEIEFVGHSQKFDWDVSTTSYFPWAPLVNPQGSNFSSPYPIRGNNELTITIFNELLDKDLNILYCDSKDERGFQIILHSPYEVPMVGHRKNVWTPNQFNETSIGQYFILPMERKLQLIVEPKAIRSEFDLQNDIESSRRECFFEGERKLKFFRYYSLSNCELECITNNTIKKCACVDFYMPREKNAILCDRGDLGCILGVLDDWKRLGGTFRQECNCLKSCNHVDYHAKAWYTYNPDNNEYIWNDTSLSVVMADRIYFTKEKKRTFTFVDFLSTVGGLMGLFCGVSIISIIEIIYHGSFRVFATVFYRWSKEHGKC